MTIIICIIAFGDNKWSGASLLHLNSFFENTYIRVQLHPEFGWCGLYNFPSKTTSRSINRVVKTFFELTKSWFFSCSNRHFWQITDFEAFSYKFDRFLIWRCERFPVYPVRIRANWVFRLFLKRSLGSLKCITTVVVSNLIWIQWMTPPLRIDEKILSLLSFQKRSVIA